MAKPIIEDVTPDRTRCPMCGYDFLSTYDVETLPKMCRCPKCREYTPRTDLVGPDDDVAYDI